MLRVKPPKNQSLFYFQIDALGKDGHPTTELRQSIQPYLNEAGLDIDKLTAEPGLITQGLMLYNVILKRKLELDDITKGMTNKSSKNRRLPTMGISTFQ